MYIATIIIVAIVVVVLAGMFYYSQNHTVDQICDHPELSGDQTKAITDIATNNHKILKLFENFITFFK